MPDQPVYYTDAIPQAVKESAAAMRKACLEWPTSPAYPDLKTPNLGTYLNICLAVRKPSLLNKVEQSEKTSDAPSVLGGDAMVEGAMYGAGGASALLIGLLLLVLLVRRSKRKPQAAAPVGSASRPIAANAFGVNARAEQELAAELNMDAR